MTPSNRDVSIQPPFIDAVSDAHTARLARLVVLTGNIRDLFAVGEPLTPSFVTLEAVVQRAESLRRERPERFVVLSVKSDGPRLPSTDDSGHLSNICTVLSSSPRTSELSTLAIALAGLLSQMETRRQSPAEALGLIASLLRIVSRLRQLGVPVRPLAVILDHAEAIFPNGPIGGLSAPDREVLKAFYDLVRDPEIWADSNTAELRPDFVILLSPTLHEINAGVLRLPRTIHVPIPLPDEPARRTFVAQKMVSYPVVISYPGGVNPVEALVQDSRGLTLVALDDLLTRANRGGTPISRRSIVAEVNRELQAGLGNVIEIVYPDHRLGDVLGFHHLKRRLAQLRRRLDNPTRAPAGMTVIGPNGSGKTFIAEAFAADTGRVVVRLTPIRGEWLGQTDTLAEMFESAVSAFGRVAILVDEAHVAFGSGHDPRTHETEARLTSHLIRMMDDESNRGSIFWTLTTSRPDLLHPDFVRQGRCSVFVPIFDPEGQDAEDYLAWVLGRVSNDGIEVAAANTALFRERTRGFSAGEYRELAGDFVEARGHTPGLSVRDFMDGWTPSAAGLADQREFQSLLAAARCDWRELLPTRFSDLSREVILDRINALSRRFSV